MARLISREFNPTAPVVVRRFFVAAGRHWNPGDLFNWRQISVSQRRVKQLFDAGKLMHADGIKSDWKGLQAREAAAAPTPTPEPAIEIEARDQNILATAAAEPADTPAQDDLTDLNMKELRAIADELGVPYKLRSDDQRDAIREARNERQD